MGPSTVPLGCPQFTLLKAFTSSARNCAPMRSVMVKFLLSEISAWKKRGPKNESLATLPNVPACGRLQGPLVQPLRANSDVVTAPHPDALPSGAIAYHCCRLGF